MMDNYERIAEIKAELNYLDNHRSYLEQLKKELASLLQRKKELEKQLIKENKDVENLEKTTITSLFQSLIGKKEERLEKERYEAMQTSLAYHKAKNEYDMTLASVQNLENRYAKEESLLKELETLQLKSSLMSLEEKEQFQKMKRDFDEKEKVMKEIKEAQKAGYIAFEVLEKVQKNLNSAKNWGTYDLIGGDFLGAMMKHSRIDEAQRLLQESIYKLNAFEKELKDVQGFHLDLINLSTWDYTFDILFDNIFTDMSIQNKINQSLNQIRHALHQVETTLQQLNIDLQNIHNEKEILQKQMQEIIKNAE